MMTKDYRTKRTYARVSPETLAILKMLGISTGDLITSTARLLKRYPEIKVEELENYELKEKE